MKRPANVTGRLDIALLKFADTIGPALAGSDYAGLRPLVELGAAKLHPRNNAAARTITAAVRIAAESRRNNAK